MGRSRSTAGRQKTAGSQTETTNAICTKIPWLPQMPANWWLSPTCLTISINILKETSFDALDSCHSFNHNDKEILMANVHSPKNRSNNRKMWSWTGRHSFLSWDRVELERMSLHQHSGCGACWSWWNSHFPSPAETDLVYVSINEWTWKF